MDALENLAKIIEIEFPLSYSGERTALSKEKIDDFLNNTVLIAYMKIAEKLKSYRFNTHYRRFPKRARLTIGSNDFNFNFTVGIDNEHSIVKIGFFYKSKILKGIIELQLGQRFSSPLISAYTFVECETVSLSKYKELDEEKIIEKFTEYFLQREQLAEKEAESLIEKEQFRLKKLELANNY
jgi:hypothetical protein